MDDAKLDASTPSRARGASVLVIDDEAMIRAMTCALLAHMGYDAEAVATGDQAVAALGRSAAASRAVAVVLLDLQLEAELGIDVCRRIRSAGFDVPVVCMSGSHCPPDLLVRDAGFDGSIAKPFSATQLQSCIEHHVGQSARGPRGDSVPDR